MLPTDQQIGDMARAGEVLLYGLPRGETERWTEALLSANCRSAADVGRVIQVASADGWHSFRIAGFVLGSKPDFASTVAA